MDDIDTPSARLVSRVVGLALALLSGLGCGGDDVCSMIDGPDTFQVAALEDDELVFKVDSAPLPVRYRALMSFRGIGLPDGLRISFAPGGLQSSIGQAECMSMEGDSYTRCHILVDVQPGESFRIGIHGEEPGRYNLEGSLYDYVNAESLFESPVCHVSIQITVSPAD